MIEPLEPRRLLSASLVRGILTINGTNKADSIIVTTADQNKRLYIKEQVLPAGKDHISDFKLSSVKRINITARGGNDVITVTLSKPIPARVDCAAGNDSVAAGGPVSLGGAGGGNNTLLGGAGNDLLHSYDGNDSLDGGAGSDSMASGRGDDTLVGGPGQDFLHGEDGDDSFFAKDSAYDDLRGGEGHDTAKIDFQTDGVTPYDYHDIFVEDIS